MGVVRGGALSDRILAQHELLWPVPEHWSLEDAATVPLPYAHAFYCLVIRADVRHGMRVVIHGGAGAFGQALISVALHLKCQVFVAVSDMKKKQFLMKLYPELKEDHIGCSRDRNFTDLVLSNTTGGGCDVVITCGQGEIKSTFLGCCGERGIILDTSPLNSQENYLFGLGLLTYDRNFMTVDFSSIFGPRNKDLWKKLQGMIAQGIQTGYVRPLSRVTYMPEETSRAFLLLAASRHRGRVLVRLQPTPRPACPRLFCTSDRCQLLISDEEGPAMQLADRLVKRGARTLHLHFSTTMLRSHPLMKSWEKLGVKVQITSDELTNSKMITNLLNDSLRTAPIEGIFVMVTNGLNSKKQKMYEMMVTNLDLAVRKTCPTIKYFAVVGVKNSIGQRVCLSRGSDRLPAMMLHVSAENATSVDAKDLINAVEQGLCSGQSAILAHYHVDGKVKTLREQIAAVAGVTFSNDSVGSATLQDLGVPSDKAQAISISLRDTYNVSIDEEKILTLTMDKLRDIEEMLKESEYTPKEGLNALFTYVDPEELLATVELVSLPTLSQYSELRGDEFSCLHSQSFLCVIPGLEGHHHRYRLMCERLKILAFVLQPGLDRPCESNQEMTTRYAKTLLKTVGASRKFYLLGYEMGVLTALEMAAILEDHGLTGTVFCLGGGPEDFLSELEDQLQVASAGVADSEQALQIAVARHMCALMGYKSTAQLETALQEAPSWKLKVEASLRVLRGRVTHSAQYARTLIEAAYARVTQTRRYAKERIRATPRVLDSRVVLLRSPSQHRTPHPLQRYSNHPLAVHDLRAPLTHATDDLRVAAIINQYLDDELLQDFESKNLCETYVMNADVFMTA